MDVGRAIVKLIVGGSCVLGGVAFPPLLAGEGIVWGTVLATALGSVAAGNTANVIDALLDGGEGRVSLENQDLTKAVGKAIAAVITLAAKQQRGKTRQYLEKIAAQAKDNWVAIAQQELTQHRYPELREAQLDQFLTPEESQLTQQGNLTATEWGDIFIRLNMAACKGGGFPIPSEVRQQVAELLHTTFPKALRETLKEDFANDGKAFAGLTLQLLTGMQAQLRQLQANQEGVNVEEFSQVLQQFQELETRLRGSVTQQQEFFRDISRGIESGFAEVCQRLGVMETTISELLQTLEERLEELRQEVTEFRQEVRQGLEALHNQPGVRQFSKQEYRNRQNILTQMRTEVESRLTQSIHRAAFVNLGKEQQPQQVQRPWDMSVKVGEQRRVQLPPQTTILDVFDNPTISGKFLILGKPGGGKTTTLLELAEALLERAEGDSNAPIPVILELSTWQEVTKRKFLSFGKPEKYDPSINEWVLSQLISKGVSQDIGEQWLREKELVLLLDGLDELQPERQGKCVRAINQFLGGEFSPLHLVVCSRKEEYEVYEEMLQLNGAICVEDLTNEQIQGYFASVNLGEFWESIKGSEKIVNFIRQPLFLAVTSIAYEQIDVEEWRNCNMEERAIDYLLGIYRLKMLNNCLFSKCYSKNKIPKVNITQKRLTRIAKYMTWHNLKYFGKSSIQLDLLPLKLQIIIINNVCGISTLLFFMAPLLYLGVIHQISSMFYICFLLLCIYLPIALEYQENIQTRPGEYEYSPLNFAKGFFDDCKKELFNQDSGFGSKLLYFSLMLIVFMLTLSPNLFFVIGELIYYLPTGLLLLLMLYFTDTMPWNITRFLDYCTERLILQRVGNRYRFIHRLVQEHFAKLEIQKD